MTVISNFDDISPARSGTQPTITSGGRSGNGAHYSGTTHKNFYFASVPLVKDSEKVYSAWVKLVSGTVALAGLTLTTSGAETNGYQFFIDNRNGSGTTASMQIRRDTSTSAVLASYEGGGIINNGNWYKIEATWRDANPNLVMRVYDESENLLARLEAIDRTYDSTSLYVGGYGYGEVILDDFAEEPYTASDPERINTVLFTPTGNDYLYRKRIKIPRSNVSGSHTDFPVFFRTVDPDLRSTSNGGGVVFNSGMTDVRFETVGGSHLSHEHILYTPSTGEYEAWIKLPYLSGSNDYIFYMYYGKSISSSEQNKTAVWTNNFRGVWHLDDNPDGSSGTSEHLDSTASPINGSSFGSMNSADSINGKLTKAIDFDGVNDTIRIPHNSNQNFTSSQNFTVSIWARFPSQSGTISIMEKWNTVGGGQSYPYIFRIVSNKIQASQYNGSTSFGMNSNSTYHDNQWHSIHYVKNGGTLYMYIDGWAEVHSRAAGTGTLTTTSHIHLGARGSSTATNGQPDTHLKGQLDEFRIIGTARSASWIATEYVNQSNPEEFYEISSPETRSFVSKLSESGWTPVSVNRILF